ncbi:MAG TPA: hypothetical protein PKA05_00965 [Roseiflexaceae bacterium]|nr:hypothetical protein [Roseiflexaceae bacterium]HMP38926.1 hypothetical protein [Roseiflexaceae bacterium]
MYDEDRGRFPPWVIGLLIAGVLIVLGGRLQLGNPTLMHEFSVRATPPGAPLELPALAELSPETERMVRELRERFEGGAAIPPLTPTANDSRLVVIVQELRRNGDRVQIRGVLRNTAAAPMIIQPGAFAFRDSSGVTYGTDSLGGATIDPAGEIPFDLAVPLPAERGLTLILSIPPEPPLELILLLPQAM